MSKGVHEGCILSPCLFKLYLPGSSIHGIFQARVLEWGAIAFSDIQSTSCEMPGWMKHKLESTLLGEISITSVCRWHHPYGRKWGGTKKLLDENERGEWKSWLKTQHSKNEDYGILSYSVKFSSIVQSCPTLCDSMNHSTPGLPVYHQLPEFTQTHIHRVRDVIQPSHPLSSPSPPAPNPSQHQSLFQQVNSLHEVAKVLEFQL